MEQLMIRSLNTIITCFSLLLGASSVQSALLGTELSIETLYQGTQTSTPTQIGFLTTATVSDSVVEFPSLADLETGSGGMSLVDVSIDVGDDYLDIGFDNAGFGYFATGYFNGYVFTFDSDTAVTFTEATVDSVVTTLGLNDSLLSFVGNQLYVNVAGLSFNSTSYARIDLTSEGGPSPVPVPAAVWLFASGLLGLVGWRRRR
jgi:hypothetical protein